MMHRRLQKLAGELQVSEQRLSDLDDELYSSSNISTNSSSRSASPKVCPPSLACLKPLSDKSSQHCVVSDEVIDEEKARSRYFELKVDNAFGEVPRVRAAVTPS